jgi:hypothetical protein
MATKSESRDHLDSASPLPLSRLIARLSDLRLWWYRSIARIVIREFYNFPFRIQAILQRPSLASAGIPVPDRLVSRDLTAGCLLNSFWPAYSEGIRALEKRHPWIGALDIEVLGEAFQFGASWGWNNADYGSERHNRESCPSLLFPPHIPSVSSASIQIPPPLRHPLQNVTRPNNR